MTRTGASQMLVPEARRKRTIGIKDTPIRRVIHRAATFVEKPIFCLALVMKERGVDVATAVKNAREVALLPYTSTAR